MNSSTQSKVNSVAVPTEPLLKDRVLKTPLIVEDTLQNKNGIDDI